VRLLALLTASLVAFAPSADAKCAMQHLAADVLPDAPNGAIVMINSTNYDNPDDEDVSTWKLRVDGKNVAPVIEVLAPGLSVYRLPTGATAGELVDGKTTLAKITAQTSKPLPAPKVKSVKHDKDERSARTSVALTGDAPADAVAIVITDAKGTALSWGRVNVYGAGIEPYEHGRCGMLPNGTVEPTVGSSVRLFWVDKYGRASAKSAAIKVAKAP
jgi:hypothetical protein